MPRDFPSLQGLSILKSSKKNCGWRQEAGGEEAVLTQLKNPDLIWGHTGAPCLFPQQVESASEMGRRGFSLLQNFFQGKLCLGAGISLLYQDKTAPGGCKLQCPKQGISSPTGRCPFGTNPDIVSVGQFSPSEECLCTFIPVCSQSCARFGNLSSGFIHNCSSNSCSRR